MFKAVVRYMLEHCIYMGQQYCTQGHRLDRCGPPAQTSYV